MQRRCLGVDVTKGPRPKAGAGAGAGTAGPSNLQHGLASHANLHPPLDPATIIYSARPKFCTSAFPLPLGARHLPTNPTEDLSPALILYKREDPSPSPNSVQAQAPLLSLWERGSLYYPKKTPALKAEPTRVSRHAALRHTHASPARAHPCTHTHTHTTTPHTPHTPTQTAPPTPTDPHTPPHRHTHTHTHTIACSRRQRRCDPREGARCVALD